MRFAAIIVGMCAFSGIPAAPAAAQDSQAQSYTIRANAHSVCNLSVPQNTGASNMTLGSGSAAGAVIAIPSLNDDITAQVQPASISLTMNIVCNRHHGLRVKTGNGGLTPTVSGGAARSGFANRVDYATDANWGATKASQHTSGVSGQTTSEIFSPGAFSGNLSLNILIDESGAGHLPLTAGIYTDTLVLTLSPHF
jgi:hypothetical protein